jgi:transmembrane sensor
MDNRYQEPEDLLLDESFKKWALGSDPAASLRWEAWLQAHPEKEGLVREAKRLLALISFESHHMPEEESRRILQSILAKPRPVPHKTRVVSMVLQSVRTWHKVAAALAVLMVACLAYYLMPEKNRALRYATDFGQVQTIILPDSSKVVLNANSKLRVNSGQEVREVWLEGEGFFSVRKKARQEGDGYTKFIVHTQSLSVEVLGTEFNVKDRPTERRVVLSSGKVRLDIGQNTTPLYMKPGESVKLVGQQKRVVREWIDPQAFTAWVNRKMILKGTTVTELAVTLRELYGYEVRLEDKSIGERTLSGTLPTNDPEALLDALSTLLKVEVSRQGQLVVLAKRR